MKLLILSFDDADRSVLNVSKMLDKYSLKGTFYLDAIRALKCLGKNSILRIASFNEIGSHGVSHKVLINLSNEEVRYEVSVSKKILEEVLGETVRTFAYPMGKYNSTVKNIVAKHYESARTTKPYNFSYDTDPYELKISLYTDPHAFRTIPKLLLSTGIIGLKLCLKPWSLKDWAKFIETAVKEYLRKGDDVVVHILSHPKFIENRNEWDDFEELLTTLSSLRALRNVTVSEYVKMLREMKWKG